MKHIRQPELKCDPIFDSEGLTEEDRIAAQKDEASEIRAGKLKNGICMNCGENYSQCIGVIRCGWCSEGY